jgi:serine/threonine protein kinase
MSVPEEQDPLLNTVLGGARVQRRVSAGLLANVYLGHYERLNVPVAVKVLTPKATAQGMNKERFVREGRALAQLSHQNIIKIYNVGHDNGRYFIVMDWIQDGMNLRQLAQSRPLTPIQSLKVASRLAEALEYIHSKNLIHRDIKPANVCLRKGGVPVLMDFSLIKDQSSDVQLTAPGTIMGTVNFMPPEQAQPGGPFGNVGPWSDVYSVAGTLYWLLTGRPPFKGRTPMETIIKLIREPYVPPSQINPSVPPEVDALIAKSLAKKSEERYQSAREFIVAVEQVHVTAKEALARGTPPPLASEDDAGGPAPQAPAAGAPSAPPQGSAVLPRNWGAGASASSGHQPALPVQAAAPPPAMPVAAAQASPAGNASGYLQPGAVPPRSTGRISGTGRLAPGSGEGRLPVPGSAPVPGADPQQKQWAPTNGLDVAPDNEATVRWKGGHGPSSQQGAAVLPPQGGAEPPRGPAPAPGAPGSPNDLRRSWVEDAPSKPSWADEQKDTEASVLGMRKSASADGDGTPAGTAPPEGAATDPAPDAPKPGARPISERMHKAPQLPARARTRSKLELVLILVAVVIIVLCIGLLTYVVVNKAGS